MHACAEHAFHIILLPKHAIFCPVYMGMYGSMDQRQKIACMSPPHGSTVHVGTMLAYIGVACM